MERNRERDSGIDRRSRGQAQTLRMGDVGLSCSMTQAMEARCSRQFETWVARSECRRKCRHAVAFFDVIALDVRLRHTT